MAVGQHVVLNNFVHVYKNGDSMIRRRNDPFRDMIDRMNRMVDEFQRQAGVTDTARVPIDVQEKDDKIIVTADMPGVDKDSITVKAQDSTLSIAAEGNRELKEEGENYIRKERSKRRFSRRINLPAPVDSSSATASYDNGVLEIELEKLATSDDNTIHIE